ncbi:MAG: TRAP transporter small permease subunit [Pseudomonadota bacterium]
MSVLFIAQITIVVLRYAFGVGFLELQDMASYSFAMLVVLSIPVALRLDRHVRVDIFRSRQQITTQRRFDRFGIVLLLFPVFAMTLYIVMPQVIYSWQILEAGVETGGLPGYFLIKTALPATCFLMLLQGAALMLGENSPSTGIEAAGERHGK